MSLQRLRPLVLCGPSGSGKSTLLKRMLEDFPDKFGFSISHTTRKPRPGERDGEHYHFTTLEEMRRAIDANEFIETATFCNNLYGTSRASVRRVQDQGKICVLDIDVQGVKQVKRTDLDPWYVFVRPPSLQELRRRLEARKTETEETLKHRLQVASEEIDYGTDPQNFHFVVINDNFDHAYAQLKQFIVEKVLQA